MLSKILLILKKLDIEHEITARAGNGSGYRVCHALRLTKRDDYFLSQF